MNSKGSLNPSDQLTARKIKPQNVVCHLMRREHGIGLRPGTQLHAIRNFYKCVLPNLTVINIEKPPGFLRKFSPDGKYLIAFTLDQTSLEIYYFNGIMAAAELVNPWKSEVVPNCGADLPYTIRSQIFEKLFKVLPAGDVDFLAIISIFVIPISIFSDTVESNRKPCNGSEATEP